MFLHIRDELVHQAFYTLIIGFCVLDFLDEIVDFLMLLESMLRKLPIDWFGHRIEELSFEHVVDLELGTNLLDCGSFALDRALTKTLIFLEQLLDLTMVRFQ